MNTFDRIQLIAHRRGVSLRELNDKAGLGTNAIYRWRVQQPSVDKLVKVARTLGVSTDYLLGNATTTDTKDIQDMLQDVIDGLSNRESLLFLKNGGEVLSQEDAELLRVSLENTRRISKYIAKQKHKQNQDS